MPIDAFYPRPRGTASIAVGRRRAMKDEGSPNSGAKRPATDRARVHEQALRIIARAGCERCGPEQMRCADWEIDDDTCWPCFAQLVLTHGVVAPPPRASRRSSHDRKRRVPAPSTDDDSSWWARQMGPRLIEHRAQPHALGA